MENDRNNPHLIRIKQGTLEKVFRLNQDEFTLGRGPTATIRIDSNLISGEHLGVKIKGNQVMIKDLGSKHGTFIGGTKIEPSQDVLLKQSNEEIHLGNIVTITIKPREAATGEAASTQEVEFSLSGVAIASAAVGGATSRPVAAAAKITPPKFKPVAEMSTPSLRLVSDAEFEADMLRAGAQKFAQGLREETRREATHIINEAKQKKELVDQEREKLEDAITEIRADFEVLNANRSRLEQEVVRSESQIKALEGSLADLKSRKEEYEKQLFYAQNRKGEVENETSSLKSKMALIREEIAAADRTKQQKLSEIDELQATVTEIRQSINDARDIYAKQKEIAELELRSQKAHQDTVMAELRAKHLAFEGTLGQLEAQRDSLQREIQDFINGKTNLLVEAEKIKRQADKEVERAEEKVRVFEQESNKIKDRIESQHRTMDELRIQSTEYRNTITHLEIEREKLIAENAGARGRLEQSLNSLNEAKNRSEYEVKELKAHIEALNTRREQLSTEYNQTMDELARKQDSAKADLQKLKTQIRDLQSTLDTARAESEETKNKALIAESRAATAEEHLGKIKQEIATSEAQSSLVKRDLLDLKQNIEKEIREITAKRDAMRLGLESETAKQREALERELANRRAHYDREFEETRKAKLDQIEKLQDAAKLEEKTRRAHILDEIILGTLQMAKKGPLLEQEEDFRDMVFAAMAGKTAATLSAKAAQRTRLFWRKIGLGALGPALILITLAIFPNLIHDIKVSLSNRADLEKKESGGLFMDEIRSRGQVFQPEKMDQNYRRTYTDNIIYVTGYVDLKRNEEKQREWTLILNDFLVGRLGLSDRVIPEFVSTEAVMVQNLVEVRKGILPQFKEQGLQRMAEIENREVGKLMAILQTPENYTKFRALEKSFYADYMLSRSDPAKK